jgi:hypothetical protein
MEYVGDEADLYDTDAAAVATVTGLGVLKQRPTAPAEVTQVAVELSGETGSLTDGLEDEHDVPVDPPVVPRPVHGPAAPEPVASQAVHGPTAPEPATPQAVYGPTAPEPAAPRAVHGPPAPEPATPRAPGPEAPRAPWQAPAEPVALPVDPARPPAWAPPADPVPPTPAWTAPAEPAPPRPAWTPPAAPAPRAAQPRWAVTADRDDAGHADPRMPVPLHKRPAPRAADAAGPPAEHLVREAPGAIDLTGDVDPYSTGYVPAPPVDNGPPTGHDGAPDRGDEPRPDPNREAVR